MAVAAALVSVTFSTAVALHEPWQGGSGVFEPSTPYDTSEYIWQGAPHDQTDRIYFNGFVVHSRIPSSVVQLDGGTFVTGDDVYFGAMLGFWRDCNGDNYIGAKNVPASYGNWVSGAYPRGVYGEDASVCEPGSPYNAETFVDEFRWIGKGAAGTPGTPPPAPCNPFTPFSCLNGQWGVDYNDVSATTIVWADFGKPFDAEKPEALLAHGTLDDLHSTMWRIDRLFPVSGLVPVWNSIPQFGECSDPDNRQFLGGPSGQCGLYPLWQAKRLVNDSDSNEEHAEPLVTVYDTQNDNDGNGRHCDDVNIAGTLYMSDPNPSVHPNFLVAGSVGGTVVNVMQGTNQGSFNGGGASGKCRTYTSENVEHDRPITEGKDRVSAELWFQPDKRLRLLNGAGVQNIPMDGLGLTGGPNGPWDSAYAGLSGGAKYISLDHEIRGPPLREPLWTTMYADIPQEGYDNSGVSASEALPAGSDNAHEYGLNECNGNYNQAPTPNAFGWVCNNAQWDIAANADPTAKTSVRLGTLYDLRDVDCYDMQIASLAGVDVGIPGIPVNDANGDPLRAVCP